MTKSLKEKIEHKKKLSERLVCADAYNTILGIEKDVKKAVLEFERFVKQSIIDDDEPDIKLIMLNFRQIFGDWTNK